MTDTTDMTETTSQYVHKTVLLHESIDGLGIMPGDTYLDGTLGSAGHAAETARKGTPEHPITIVGIDQDTEALARSQERLDKVVSTTGTKVFLVKESYRNLDKVLADLASKGDIPTAQANRIMLDLGLSSDQFETSGRGFSFQRNEPLLMTFKSPKSADAATEAANGGDYILTARDIVNTWEEANIADIVYGYGDERYSRHIARKIVESRAEKPIETTFDLVDIIKKATPGKYHHGKIHPATKTFQALRITVNDEIGALKEGLVKGFDKLAPGGRMAIISFHSIEDRLVKNFYKERASEGTATILTKKPLTAGDDELRGNPRARSAKLRIIEKKQQAN